MLDIPERTIRRHIKEGILNGSKVGDTWRLTEEDLTNYLNNSHISNSQKKLALTKVIEYMSGINVNDKEVVIIKRIDKLDYAKSMKLSLLTKTFKYPLYFNLSKSGKKSTITFRGHEEDALKLLVKIKNLT
jgi:excisionase family DNA binding protein